MASLNNVVGFVFSFMIVSAALLFFAVSMVESIKDQSELKTIADTILSESYISIKDTGSYYSSQRLKIFLENSGPSGIRLSDDEKSCLDLFVNDRFIDDYNYKIYLGKTPYDYSYIDSYEKAVLDVQVALDEKDDIKVLLSTCAQTKELFYYEAENFNWLDKNYLNRSKFIVTENDESVINSKFNISLNSSNFDFENSDNKNFEIFLPVNENILLDINFDYYGQTLFDHSKYGSIIYLGGSDAILNNDPSEEKGVFFRALDFDGENDYVQIEDSLYPLADKAVTFSAWVKMENMQTGEMTSIYEDELGNGLFMNSSHLAFSLIIDGTMRNIISNKIDNVSLWHLVSGSYNGSEMSLFVDLAKVSSLQLQGDISTSGFAAIGSNPTGVEGFFSGLIDDFKIFNIGLNKNQVTELYQNRLTHIPLESEVIFWNQTAKQANISVTIPYIKNDENLSIELYYNKNEKELKQII